MPDKNMDLWPHFTGSNSCMTGLQHHWRIATDPNEAFHCPQHPALTWNSQSLLSVWQGEQCLRQQVANNNHAAHGTCIICTPSVLLARSIKDWVNPLKSISSKHPPLAIRRARRGKEITSHILEVDILNSCCATTRGN